MLWSKETNDTYTNQQFQLERLPTIYQQYSYPVNYIMSPTIFQYNQHLTNDDSPPKYEDLLNQNSIENNQNPIDNNQNNSISIGNNNDNTFNNNNEFYEEVLTEDSIDTVIDD